MTRVLYPGSFDPITKGHMNVIEKAAKLFDEVVVAVMPNSKKTSPFFTFDQRLKLIKSIYQDNNQIKVISGQGATVDIAILNECKAIIRGLRGVTDFDYEIQLASVNKELSNDAVETVCLFPDNQYQYISSTVVKEVFSIGKPIDKYVDEKVKLSMEETRKGDLPIVDSTVEEISQSDIKRQFVLQKANKKLYEN